MPTPCSFSGHQYTPRIMKIVLDTNVLMNGVQDENSVGHRLIQAVLEGKIQAAISHRIKRENELITRRELHDQEYIDLLDQFYQKAEWIRPLRQLHAVTEDHEDDKFVDAAVAASADYVVTSDSDLLDLGEIEGVKMITPQVCWNILSGDSGEDNAPWKNWMKSIGLGN